MESMQYAVCNKNNNGLIIAAPTKLIRKMYEVYVPVRFFL